MFTAVKALLPAMFKLAAVVERRGDLPRNGLCSLFIFIISKDINLMKQVDVNLSNNATITIL